MTTIDIDWATAPRSALLDEMFTALGNAISCDPDTPERHFYKGVADGYGIGFGVVNRSLLTEAHGNLYAAPLLDTTYLVERLVGYTERHPYTWQRHVYDAGLLTGWWQVTAERCDTTMCALCDRRLVTDSDDVRVCACGDFCSTEHFGIYHNGRSYCMSVDQDGDV